MQAHKNPSDVELEIKLAADPAQFSRLTSFVIAKGGVRRTRLQAAYIDTPDFKLAKAGIACRLRKEGRFWIQTIKAPHEDPLSRLEHNVRIQPVGQGFPVFDLKLHANHEAGQKINQVLQPAELGSLAVRFETDIYRRTASVKGRGALLEYALDEGVVFVTLADGGRSVREIRELEIELIDGNPELVLVHAKTIIRRFKAYFQTKTKALHGYELANQLEHSPAVKALPTSLGRRTNRDIAMAILANSMMQILPNAAEIAAGVSDYDDHLHQLRVGLRRLRTGLKILGLQHIYLSESNIAVLANLFSKLGLYRDANFLSEKLSPALQRVKAPPMELIQHVDFSHPADIIKNTSVQLLLADLMLMLTQFKTHLGDEKTLKVKIIGLLDHLLGVTKKIANRYLEVGDESRHDLRKKLKRLRYTLEFSKDICKASDYKKYLRELGRVAEILGDYNDVCVALEKVNDLVDVDKNILFAQGWLAAEKDRLLVASYKALEKFYRLKKVW